MKGEIIRRDFFFLYTFLWMGLVIHENEIFYVCSAMENKGYNTLKPTAPQLSHLLLASHPFSGLVN